MRVILSNGSIAWGGVHGVTEMLARGLAERGHEVAVLGRRGTMLEARMRGVAAFFPILGGTDLSPASVARALRALRRPRADVVVALNKKDVRQAGVAARILGIPLVIRHGNDQPLPRGLRGRLLYGGALHVTNAAATRHTLLASAPWLDPAQVEVIHNGIDPRPWEAAEPAVLGLPAGAVRFGYVGSFAGRKGVDTLARVWWRVAARLPDAHLLLAGKHLREEPVRALLEGAPRVHWLGYRADVPRVMRSLDVLVLPSRREGAPNVVLEAMAAGVAVVATAVSGTPELVRDGVEARLCPPRDPEALADAMLELGADPSLRARLAAAGAARVRAEFTLERMLDRYEALLSRVAESANRTKGLSE
jgi:glycosyltransferase involved in cell wall biosynthesis